MSFKESLKTKMLVDALVRTASPSIGSPGKGRKVDKETIRKLLSLSPFVLENRRGLEIYFRMLEPGIGEVLVLDNELPLYGNTTVYDVVLRRSPELKEMISIRNVIKILNDSDILMCRGRDALRYVRDRVVDLLDLRYQESDIKHLADEGTEALGRADSGAVMETLDLFVEILGYESIPAAVLVNDYVMFGARHGEGGFGPVIMYNDRTNILRLVKQVVAAEDPVTSKVIPAIALGEVEPGAEGYEVFDFLMGEVMKMDRPTVH